jgi:hypothetical protein
LKGYDEPEILRSQLSRFGPISADAGQAQSVLFPVSWSVCEPQTIGGFESVSATVRPDTVIRTALVSD